jgi:hypothetical protein
VPGWTRPGWTGGLGSAGDVAGRSGGVRPASRRWSRPGGGGAGVGASAQVAGRTLANRRSGHGSPRASPIRRRRRHRGATPTDPRRRRHPGRAQ